MAAKKIAAWASGSGRDNRLLMLTYHSVFGNEDPNRPGKTTIARFSRHMRVLADYFNTFTVTEAARLLVTHRLPPRSVCVTFDDGYLDNYTNALPLLTRYGVNATFFVATGYLDGGVMWNDLVREAIHNLPSDTREVSLLNGSTVVAAENTPALVSRTLDQLKYLDPAQREVESQRLWELTGLEKRPELMMRSDMVRDLAAHGMEIGAHTMSHPILSAISDQDAEHEIRGSKNVLEDLLDTEVTSFAYPNGCPGKDFTERDVDIVRAAGFSAAVTTEWAAASGDSSVHELPRIGSWDDQELKFFMRLVSNFRSTNTGT